MRKRPHVTFADDDDIEEATTSADQGIRNSYFSDQF